MSVTDLSDEAQMAKAPLTSEQKRALEVAEYVDGLRKLADHLADHPDLVPRWGAVAVVHYVMPDGNESEDYIREIGRLTRQLPGKVNKTAGEFTYEVSTTDDAPFSPHGIKLISSRSNVCTRVVVDTITEEIEAPDPQLVDRLPKVKQTVEREIVEWSCPPSLLAASKDA